VVRRALPCFAVALVAVALTAAPAGAGLLTTEPAATCETQPSQPFRPWSDYARYVLVPGGSFESGSPAWSLSKGAVIVPGNEPFYVRSRSDSRSLYMPAGSSAITPTLCFAFGDWHLRFFMRNTGTRSSALRVDVVVRSALGLLSILDGGSVSADGVWRPSPRVGLLVSNVTSLLGTEAVAFRFRAVGTGAAFQVDDVYLDPWKSS
jgi:hypothetical protein